MITIAVLGDPVGQGAMRSNGHGGMYESTKNHKPWRESIVYAAREAFAGEAFARGGPWMGPVSVTAVFTFRHLKAHHAAGGGIKLSAPLHKITKPDLDHLARSVGDALVIAGCLRDDAQIVHWDAVKQYGLQAGVVIKIRTMED